MTQWHEKSILANLGFPSPLALVQGVLIDAETLQKTIVVPAIGFTLYRVAIFTDSSRA